MRYYSHRTFIKTLFRLYVLADSDWYSNIHAYLTYSSHEFYTIEINIAYKVYIIHYMHIYYYNNGNSSFVYIYYVNLAQNRPTQRNAPKESKIFENYTCFIRTDKWEYVLNIDRWTFNLMNSSIRKNFTWRDSDWRATKTALDNRKFPGIDRWRKFYIVTL